MRTALLQVKEELGSEVVIMSNKKVAGGVEIVAAIDGEGATPSPRTANRQEPAPSQYTQMAAPSGAARRQLDEDRVSLQASSDTGRSMTKRFSKHAEAIQ
eukprot:TRINITY_DN25492_c0_g1_i1.p1 TRINITY_DN25492_c0_g1~~TRINITY_DN25492_c0_g1_i1.p1  ORF type:complete len:100 (+),score=18.04 TRINITY_DN25492_c0_g1_i1:90-389(+)